jgi:glycosyltransferase involved in cell wall biosynthesis
MKIALINFQHENNMRGGCETRHRLLKSALEEMGHECHLLSTRTDSIETATQLVYQCDLAISDSAMCFETPCLMITIFGNPWISVLKIMPNVFIKRIADRERDWHARHQTYKVAVSNFMSQEEMLPNGIVADLVIPNPVDIDRFLIPPDDTINEFVGTAGNFLTSNKTNPPTALWIGPEIPIKNYSQIALIRDRWSVAYPELPVQWKTPKRETEDELDYAGMTTAIAQSSVVLCTSTAEGCSNTLMEAIAANVPIVTTKTGMFWDWWDERLGIRVEDPYDTSAFILGLQTVLQNQTSFSPRTAALEKQLELTHWKLAWQSLVLRYVQ